MTLVELSRAYENAQSRARRAEEELDELKDLVATLFCGPVGGGTRSSGAACDWLRLIARTRYESRLRQKWRGCV